MDDLRVLVIAPDPLARAALATLLAEQDGFVLEQADAADDWADLVDIYTPDVIVNDLGWQNSAELPDFRDLETPLLVLAPDAEAAADAWQAGATGIVSREADADRLVAALNAVCNTLFVLDDAYLDVIRPNNLTLTALPQLIDPLTTREQDVLELLAQGLTNRAIAHQLTISDHTVKFHVNALLTKLGAQSRTEAAVKATRLGLLSL